MKNVTKPESAGVSGRAGGVGLTNRDANDEKIMATSPGNTEGRTIEASMETLNDTAVNANSDINTYYAFGDSSTKSIDNPYMTRRDTIVAALGNKDSVKG